MRAKVWKAGGLWWYKTYFNMPVRNDVTMACTVKGRRATWREAFDAACQELRWMKSV